MVPKHVLMDPGIHGRSMEEIVDTPNSLPNPRLMSDGKVATWTVKGGKGGDREKLQYRPCIMRARHGNQG